MNNKVLNYFEIARKLAISKEDKRSYLLGALGERSDGTLVKAINSPTPFPERKAHSEYRLCSKLDVGATVYVVRIRLEDGKFAMARPCQSCRKVLRSKKVVKVYYTISENEWGSWNPLTDNDHYYTRN